jgi:hypothetical protein
MSFRVAGGPAIRKKGEHRMLRGDSNRRKRPELAGRLREIREDLCGEYGAQFLADALDVRLETWLNYESGVTVPAHVVLKLIDIARVNPRWLLTGQGEPRVHPLCHCLSERALFGTMPIA